MEGQRCQPSAGVAGQDTIDAGISDESSANTASMAANTRSAAALNPVLQRRVCYNHVHGKVGCERRDCAHGACPGERGEGDDTRWEGGNEKGKEASDEKDNEADTLRSRYVPGYIGSSKGGRVASTAIASKFFFKCFSGL